MEVLHSAGNTDLIALAVFSESTFNSVWPDRIANGVTWGRGEEDSIENDDFVLKITDFVLKMTDFVLKMTDFGSGTAPDADRVQVMNFLFKMMNSALT